MEGIKKLLKFKDTIIKGGSVKIPTTELEVMCKKDFDINCSVWTSKYGNTFVLSTSGKFLLRDRNILITLDRNGVIVNVEKPRH